MSLARPETTRSKHKNNYFCTQVMNNKLEFLKSLFYNSIPKHEIFRDKSNKRCAIIINWKVQNFGKKKTYINEILCFQELEDLILSNISCPQFGLYIQQNTIKVPADFFCRNWQVDSKMYTDKQKHLEYPKQFLKRF